MFKYCTLYSYPVFILYWYYLSLFSCTIWGSIVLISLHLHDDDEESWILNLEWGAFDLQALINCYWTLQYHRPAYGNLHQVALKPVFCIYNLLFSAFKCTVANTGNRISTNVWAFVISLVRSESRVKNQNQHEHWLISCNHWLLLLCPSGFTHPQARSRFYDRQLIQMVHTFLGWKCFMRQDMHLDNVTLWVQRKLLRFTFRAYVSVATSARFWCAKFMILRVNFWDSWERKLKSGCDKVMKHP